MVQDPDQVIGALRLNLEYGPQQYGLTHRDAL